MFGMKRISTTLIAFFLFCTISFGADWFVDKFAPGPIHDGTTLKTAFLTIQEGIDAAANGDNVWVDRGIYEGTGNINLSFNGKAIKVESIKGAHLTLIDCMNQGYGFIFDNGEGTDSIVTGFTIFQAGGVDGAVVILNASPTIAGNTIRKARNTTGGGIHCVGGSPVITRNTIRNCEGAEAGGIYLELCSATVTSNMIHHNRSTLGGGIRLVDSTALVVNNTFVENSAVSAGGGLFLDDSDVTVVNTILWDNSAPSGPTAGLRTTAVQSVLGVAYSDVSGGEQSINRDAGSQLQWAPSNFDADPIFVKPSEMDYHITFDSPCRSAGARNYAGLPDYDFEMDPVQGMFIFPEIGADEFHTHFYIRGRIILGEKATGVVVGWPYTNPVVGITGTGLRRDPMHTLYGDFWLRPPWNQRVHFLPIPDNGVKEIERIITNTLTIGTEVPIQFLVGTELTNLWWVVKE
jgi:hypothetical protein